MRIALLYPPPWKISASGEPADFIGEGPPADYREGDLDADFYQTPYGLFALGAAAKRAGHQVVVLNLSAFAWTKVEEVVRALDADLFGLSCWTANRRGVVLTAQAIKVHHPNAHLVVGGPHATPLAELLLRHAPAIDTVAVGEADLAFLDLIERLERGASPTGVAGTVYREGTEIVRAAERAAVSDLDTLACPEDYFTTHIFMTSRGCPWACTFCGAETTWGRGFRAHSVNYVVLALEKALRRLPVRMVQIKDDTFTTNKKRVVELCRAIRARELNFFWSCDTRVDLLTEELLLEMRLGGCERLSLGVESGSQRILDAIDKKITVDEILRSTELAKNVGIKVRYYMMLGNRGETAETFQETLSFLERARPDEYIFSCLSIYPGTRDFTDAEKAGWIDGEAYFRGKFLEFKTPFDASESDMRLMNDWFHHNSGLRQGRSPTTEKCREILVRLGDYHAAHMDLGAAYYREGNLSLAEHHVRRALELGYPLSGLVFNHLACIAKARGDLDAMMDLFSEAARRDPQHFVLIQNVQRARAWFKAGGPSKGLPLDLEVRHDFQLFERTVQPALPGPLPSKYAEWSEPEVPDRTSLATDASDPLLRAPGSVGSKKGLGQLKVIR